MHMQFNRNQTYFHQSLSSYIETLQVELVRNNPVQQIGVSGYVHYQFHHTTDVIFVLCRLFI